MSQLTEEERANLVAYLDGELEEGAAHALEARLSRDPALRAEAEALKRTWELLDYLPRPEPSGGFTHRTLERLAVGETGRVGRVGQGRWIWLAPVGWAAAMLIAMAGGLFVARHFWPPAAATVRQDQNRQTDFDSQVARDLGPIENLRVYSNIDDLEFARALPETLPEEEGDL